MATSKSKSSSQTVTPKVNESLATFSRAYVPIDHDLNVGDEVSCIIEGAVIGVSFKDNQDGTVNRIAEIRGYIAEVQTDEGGEAIEIQRGDIKDRLRIR